MIDEVEYRRLKRRVTRLERQRERAEGAKEEILATLQKEFKCNSVKEARRVLRRLKRDQQKAEAKFELELNRFNKRFGKLLDRLEEEGL